MRTDLQTWQDIAIPILLCTTGSVLVVGDWIGILSLDAIENLWPCALIVLGLVAMACSKPITMRNTKDAACQR